MYTVKRALNFEKEFCLVSESLFAHNISCSFVFLLFIYHRSIHKWLYKKNMDTTCLCLLHHKIKNLFVFNSKVCAPLWSTEYTDCISAEE